MKNFFAALVTLVMFHAHAGDFGTQDKVPYLISYVEGTQVQTCTRQIQKLARKLGCDGKVKVIFQIDDTTIVRTTLTTLAADQVAQLACVAAVEAEGEVEGQPRVGRNN